MNSIVFKITQAGLNATVNNNGVAATINRIGFGTGAYTPRGTETTLSAQEDIINLGSGVKTDNVLTLSATLSGAQDYTIREIGIFLADGTLFAVYSHLTNAISQKTANADFEFVYVFTITGVDADNITINADAIGAADIRALRDGKADLAGSASQAFEVATATTSTQAINKAQLEAYSSSYYDFLIGFSQTDITDSSTDAQIDTLVNSLERDVEYEQESATKRHIITFTNARVSQRKLYIASTTLGDVSNPQLFDNGNWLSKNWTFRVVAQVTLNKKIYFIYKSNQNIRHGGGEFKLRFNLQHQYNIADINGLQTALDNASTILSQSISIGRYVTSTGAYSIRSLTAYKDTAGSYSFTPDFTGSIEVTLAAASGGFAWGFLAPNTNLNRGGTTSFGTQTLAGAGGGYGANIHTQASGGGGYVQAAGNNNADGGLGSGFDGVAGDGESIIHEGIAIANGGRGQNPRKFTVNVVSGTTYFGVVGVKGLNSRDHITGGGPGAVRIRRVS